MAEWLKAHAWKACIRESVSWVRIPLSPPAFFAYAPAPAGNRLPLELQLHSKLHLASRIRRGYDPEVRGSRVIALEETRPAQDWCVGQVDELRQELQAG